MIGRLAPPRCDLPENPVGRTFEIFLALPEFSEVHDARGRGLHEARKSTGTSRCTSNRRVHRVVATAFAAKTHAAEADDGTFAGEPLRIWAAGKAYRLGTIDAMHLEAFHQMEVLALDERERLDQWAMTGRVLASVHAVLPGRSMKIVPTEYTMCKQAWQLEVEADDRWAEVLAWGCSRNRVCASGRQSARNTAIEWLRLERRRCPFRNRRHPRSGRPSRMHAEWINLSRARP